MSDKRAKYRARLIREQRIYDGKAASVALADPNLPEREKRIHTEFVVALREADPDTYAELRTWCDLAAKDGSAVAAFLKTKPPFSPAETEIGDVFTWPPAAPRFIVDRILPRSHGIRNGQGGVGKSSLTLWEAAHLILGRDLYGQRVLQPGPVLIISKEDDRELFAHRLHGVIAAMPDLTDADQKRIADSLHLLVLTGQDARLVEADRSGNLRQTDLVERVTHGYKGEGLSLIEIDPLNLFGPGERFINDGEAAVLSAMARLSQELKCATRAISHISKAAARSGLSDVHTSRGGSSAGDNSRHVTNLWKVDTARDKDIAVPPNLAPLADMGNLYYLDFVKLTAARPAHDRVWLTREGFRFSWQPDDRATPQERRAAIADADAQAVWAYIKAAEGRHYTARELEGEAAAIGVPQKRVRAALIRLQSRGRVVEADLPSELCRGRRQTYLRAVPEPVAALDTSVPVAEQMAN